MARDDVIAPFKKAFASSDPASETSSKGKPVWGSNYVILRWLYSAARAPPLPWGRGDVRAWGDSNRNE